VPDRTLVRGPIPGGPLVGYALDPADLPGPSTDPHAAMFSETPLLIVEDTETLSKVVDDLKKELVIGIDTESDSFHHYQEKVCLIQVSDPRRDYILDPLKIDDMTRLGEVLEDPGIVKVLHGADYDVVCLRRDFGFRIRGLFDTMVAAQFLAMPKVGLADLIERFFGEEVDKKYQRHDWAERPLLEEHLQYARGDTHWLLALREVMLHKLVQSARLRHVEEECRLLEEREWSGRGGDPADFLRVKRSGTLDPDGLRVLRSLWTYRDEQARASDRPAFKIMPDAMLVAIASRRPRNANDLHTILRRGSALSRKHGSKLLEVVEEGLANETPIPEPTRPDRARRTRAGAGVERLMGPLRDWRNQVVESRGLAPVVVASNTMLKEVARAAPKTLDELRVVPGVRSWQVEQFGEEILGVVASAGPASESNGNGTEKRRRRRSRRK
jgi:ribonuclease D